MLLPHIDSYEERPKQLQIDELNTQLLSEVCEPSSEWTPSAKQLYTGTPDHLHHESRATQKQRMALLDNSLFFRYTQCFLHISAWA